MEISFWQQLSLPFTSFIFGLVAGVLYDTVRILRCCLGVKYRTTYPGFLLKIKLPLLNSTERKRKPNSVKEFVLVGITDILYFLILTVFMCIFVYAVNNGRIRWFIYLFSFFGFLAYYFTVGKLVIKTSTVISFFIRAIFLYLILFILAPIKAIFTCVRFCISRRTKRAKSVKRNRTQARGVLLSSGKAAINRVNESR